MTIDEEADELPEALFEGTWYRWSCVHCGSVFDDENDPRGDVVTCADCGSIQRVQS